MKVKVRVIAVLAVSVCSGLISGTVQAPIAAAQPCMVNCFDWDGGWQGGGGLQADPIDGVGGEPIGGVGLPDASGAPGGLSGFGEGTAAPESPTLCAGTNAVYTDYAVITSDCGQAPDDATELGPEDIPQPEDDLTGYQEACEFRRDILCDAAGLSTGLGVTPLAGPVAGAVAGLGAKHVCRLFYTPVCITEEP